MSLIDFARWYGMPAVASATRWAREELRSRGVRVLLTDTCLRAFVADAEATAKQRLAEPGASLPHAACLREEIAARAEFLRRWTTTDDPLDADDPTTARLMHLARAHALPRAWRLSEPVASAAKHPTPTYLYWASAS